MSVQLQLQGLVQLLETDLPKRKEALEKKAIEISSSRNLLQRQIEQVKGNRQRAGSGMTTLDLLRPNRSENLRLFQSFDIEEKQFETKIGRLKQDASHCENALTIIQKIEALKFKCGIAQKQLSTPSEIPRRNASKDGQRIKLYHSELKRLLGSLQETEEQIGNHPADRTVSLTDPTAERVGSSDSLLRRRSSPTLGQTGRQPLSVGLETIESGKVWFPGDFEPSSDEE